MDIDHKGKDSWRFAQAGSDTTTVACPGRTGINKKVERDPELAELLLMIGDDFDLVITEGFKTGKANKIEVYREDQGDELACHWRELSAVVSDTRKAFGIFVFATEDSAGIADFMEKKFITQRGDETYLSINGKVVPMNPFIKQVVSNVSLAIASSLKGIGEIKKLEILVRKKPEG